jgi:hypothetical protein
MSCVGYFTCVRVSVGGMFVYGIPYPETFDEPRGVSAAYPPKLVVETV